MLKKSQQDVLHGLAFISPWMVGFGFFTAYPLLSSLYYSLTNYNVIARPKFVGLNNYINLFTNDKMFYTALANTLYMVFIGLSFITVLTIAISILLNDRRIKGLAFFRIVFFIPTLVPLVILAILWIWILQPDAGVVNTALGWFGIEGPGWFASPKWSKPAFILMSLWGSGNMVIIYLAALQDIPASLHEAAAIDGAGYWQQIRAITIPLLRPAILFNVITGIINILQRFAEPLIITKGGPDGSTTFYSLYLYQNAFRFFKMGYACAMGWILLMITMLFTVILLHYNKKWED